MRLLPWRKRRRHRSPGIGSTHRRYDVPGPKLFTNPIVARQKRKDRETQRALSEELTRKHGLNYLKNEEGRLRAALDGHLGAVPAKEKRDLQELLDRNLAKQAKLKKQRRWWA